MEVDFWRPFSVGSEGKRGRWGTLTMALHIHIQQRDLDLYVTVVPDSKSQGSGVEGGDVATHPLDFCRPPPEDPSFRALSGRLKFTARRHKFYTDSLSGLWRGGRGRGDMGERGAGRRGGGGLTFGDLSHWGPPSRVGIISGCYQLGG